MSSGRDIFVLALTMLRHWTQLKVSQERARRGCLQGREATFASAEHLAVPSDRRPP